MRSFLLRREQWIARPIEDVFTFFAEARNLEAITPPWLAFRVLSREPIAIQAGTHIRYRIRWRHVPLRWLTEIAEWQPPVRFVDVQRRGPYALWHHTHEFEPERGGTRMRDLVRYALPLGPLGLLMHQLVVGRDLQAIFDYRARKVEELLGNPASTPARHIAEANRFHDDHSRNPAGRLQ